jgi:hypothetical protein
MSIVDQLGASFGNCRAGPRADLDLRAQELGAHLLAELGLARGHQRSGRFGDQIARAPVNQVVFLLDADGECRLDQRHGAHASMGACSRQWRAGRATGLTPATLWHQK